MQKEDYISKMLNQAYYENGYGNELMDIKCSLCDMEFDSTDNLFILRCIRHTEFHTNAQVQKRNTTNGVPKFIPNVVKHITVNKVNKEVKEIE